MKRNLFDISGISDFSEEVFEELIAGGPFRLQRIVSLGQSTPENKWYDQDQDEWILLLSGNAELLFQDTGEVIELVSGDCLCIEAHRKHRVTRTDLLEKTIWLGLFFDAS